MEDFSAICRKETAFVTSCLLSSIVFSPSFQVYSILLARLSYDNNIRGLSPIELPATDRNQIFPSVIFL